MSFLKNLKILLKTVSLLGLNIKVLCIKKLIMKWLETVLTDFLNEIRIIFLNLENLRCRLMRRLKNNNKIFDIDI